MEIRESVSSYDQFIESSPQLMHLSTMLAHYSEERLFSDEARLAVIAPDLEPIPLY